MQLDIGGCGAGELDDGGDPAEDLLGCGVRHAGGVGGEDGGLVGVFEQRLHAAGDRVAGGLVAAADEQPPLSQRPPKVTKEDPAHVPIYTARGTPPSGRVRIRLR